MPFVTKQGGLTSDYGVVPEEKIRNDKGDVVKVVPGNGLKPLRLGFGAFCDFNINSHLFKEIVRRGTPNLKQRNWYDTPVFRIPTNRWNDLSEQEKQRTWGRLLSFYKHNKEKDFSKVIHYEPDFEDIEIKRYGATKGFHFPLWVLHALVDMGVFEEALKRTQIENSGQKMLDKDMYEAMMIAIKEREEFEADKEMTIDAKVARQNFIETKGNAARADGRTKHLEEKNNEALDEEIKQLQEKSKAKVSNKKKDKKELSGNVS
ncbi:MAG: hypothetical protein HRT47_01455 [Candidatus Caenarcaniphilales bacterium]|nr:hypothetical protein [Candidatus Caenarcaniphilales bacterium]